MNTLEQTIESPAFKAAMQVTDSLGQFHENPSIDKAYKTLRLMGLSADDAKEMIEKEINRRM